MIGTKHEHIIGRFTVRTEWKNNVLYYDVYRGGLLYASGFDRLSLSEGMAVDAIRERILGKFGEGRYGSH